MMDFLAQFLPVFFAMMPVMAVFWLRGGREKASVSWRGSGLRKEIKRRLKDTGKDPGTTNPYELAAAFEQVTGCEVFRWESVARYKMKVNVRTFVINGVVLFY